MRGRPRNSDPPHVRLAASVVIAALALVSASQAAPMQTSRATQTTLEASMTRVINTIRRNHGLGPLIVSTRLSTAAAAHTREMGTDGYFSHESRDGSSFWKR